MVLSVIIVTRNTAALLAGLLASLEADPSLDPALKEVIVVDNGSTDGTDVLLEEKFPSVLYVRNRENRGFAAAVNEGYFRSSGDLLLFLNSDTRIIKGELVKMLQYMEQTASAGVVGPLLVYPDLGPQRSFAPFPSLLTEIVPRFLLERVFPEKFPQKGRQRAEPAEVESLIGAALLIRREVLGATGGFDEDFFFFLEETDLCLRAREKGYGVVFFPDTKIIHLQGETVRKSWVRGRIEYNISLYKFIQKHHGPLYYLLFVKVRVIKNVAFLLLVSLLPFLFFSGHIRRRYRYYASLLFWHLKGCPDNYGLRFAPLKGRGDPV
jgi:GT2 family glycosyltransferase